MRRVSEDEGRRGGGNAGGEVMLDCTFENEENEDESVFREVIHWLATAVTPAAVLERWRTRADPEPERIGIAISGNGSDR